MKTWNSSSILRALAITVLLCTMAAPAVLASINRLFRDLAFSETTVERKQICEDLDPGSVPGYAALFCRGFLLLAAGEESLAVRSLEEALAQEPKFALGCVLYADSYMEHGALEEAARWYRRARSIAPDRLDPHFGLGRIWLERAETEGEPAYEKALASFREMTRIDPESPDGWGNVGMVLATLGRYEEAESSYRKALKLAPEDPQIYHSLGSLASLRGEEREAEELWKKALELDPTYLPALRELAALYGRQGKIDLAIERLEEGAEKVHFGQEAGRLRRDLALLHILGEDLDRAGELLERARELSPDARTLGALAHLRMLQGNTPAALKALAEAAVKDSAVAEPFARAWAGELSAALAGSQTESRAREQRLRRMLEDLPAAQEPEGAAATRSLVQLLLPDWQLPEGVLPMPAAPSEAAYDTAPVPVYRALASYPEAAGGIEGTVVVRVQIDEHGIVREADVVSKGGNPALEWAALDAAKRWRFEPARLKGEPVPAELTIPFRFSSVR